MYRLIQVKLSQLLLKKCRGEVSEEQFYAFINGANTALSSVGAFYTANTSEIISGTTDVPEGYHTIEEEVYFRNGFLLVMEHLESLGQDTTDLHEKYSALV